MKLTPTYLDLDPGKTLCVGCHAEISKAFNATGKVWRGTIFITKPVETELTFDQSGELVEEELIEKTIPIGNWARGTICSKCASDYRSVEHTRKDGSVWYEPRVQLDPVMVVTRNKQGKLVKKPSYSVPLNPGWSGTDQAGIDTSLVNPPSELASYEREEVDRRCYTKFARR